MSWNYRIVKYKNKDYGLHEVYYDKQGRIVDRTEDPIISCYSEEGPEGIIKSLRMALKDAKTREVLDDF
jgi:YD repeat-containing protein